MSRLASFSAAKSIAVSLTRSGASSAFSNSRETHRYTSKEEGSSSIDYHKVFSDNLYNDSSNTGFS